MIEELLELFNVDMFLEDENGTVPAIQNTITEQVHHILVCTVTGQAAPSCLQLHGWLQGHEVVMLVDSGSSASFVSQHLEPILQGVQQLKNPVRVAVANGSELKCEQEILNCPWFV